MIDFAQARIFPASFRSGTSNETYRTGKVYPGPEGEGFGPLKGFADHTLGGGSMLSWTTPAQGYVLLLPTVGTIRYSLDGNRPVDLEAGQSALIPVLPGEQLQCANAFPDLLVNYLQLYWDLPWMELPSETVYRLPLSETDRSWVPVVPERMANGLALPPVIQAWFGRFSGREEWVHRLKQPDHGLFVFVLEGAFEVQYRLLEARDALALWQAPEVELEALSERALVLAVEVAPLSGVPFF
ncbi:MAG TPA: hypothetical protein VHK69_01340 [Chitinophagaceae bacterium]|jgi:hypothetical protein|nr:hypothetical protein [Chitinophagaceae bacterium]